MKPVAELFGYAPQADVALERLDGSQKLWIEFEISRADPVANHAKFATGHLFQPQQPTETFISMVSSHIVPGRRNLAANTIHLMRHIGMSAFQTTLFPTLPPSGSPQELERKRFKAFELSQGGMSNQDIAKALDVSVRSVLSWIRIATADGVEALRAKVHPGKKPKLTAKQIEKLQAMILKGAVANGFSTELWTGPRVAQLIRDKFQVTYHDKYLPSSLRKLGFSCQKRERQARQRDEAAVAKWIKQDWERIKKNAAVERDHRFSRRIGADAATARPTDVGSRGADADSASQLAT